MMTEQHHRALDDRAGQGECRETRFCWQPLRLILRWVLPRMEAEMFAVALVESWLMLSTPRLSLTAATLDQSGGRDSRPPALEWWLSVV